jgi:hypothetical protein
MALDDRLRVLDVHDARVGIGPGNPQNDRGAEIIAPIRAYSTPHWSANLADGDNVFTPGLKMRTWKFSVVHERN